MPHMICKNCADQLVDIHTFRELFLESDCKLRARLSGFDVEYLNKLENESDDEERTAEAVDEIMEHQQDDGEYILVSEAVAKLESSLNEETSEESEPNKYITMEEESLEEDATYLDLDEDEENTLYKCDHCEKAFPSMASLRTHNYIHNQGRFECPLCPNKVLTNAGFLRVHLRMAHNIFDSKDEQLDSDTSTNRPLKNERSCLCEICNRYFTKIGIITHMRSHQSSQATTTSGGKKVIKCPLCLLTFSCRKNVQRHMKNVHSEEKQCEPATFICQICSETFQIVVQLYEHYKTHDKMCHETAEGFNLKCDDCDSLLLGTYECYAKHVVDVHGHSKVKPYKCRLCATRHVTRVALYMHINCHFEVSASIGKKIIVRSPKKLQPKRRFLCPTCGNDFCTKQILKHHMLIHSGLKPFVCKFCQKAFRSGTGLKEHIRVHTDERPNHCDLCPKKFRTHANLRNHKISAHSDEKKHCCHVCSRAFKFKANLR